MDIIKSDLDCFKTTDGTSHYFVKLHNRSVFCWTENPNSTRGTYDYDSEFMDVTKLNKEDLISLKIWDDIPKKIQKEVLDQVEIQKQLIAEKVERMQKGRKKRYNFDGLPQILTCSCGKTAKPNYYTLSKLADEKIIPLSDLIKNYRCRKCKSQDKIPTNFPEFMECKCGNKVKTNYYYLKTKAQKMGISIDNLIANYQCQKCNPTKGHKKIKAKKTKKNKKGVRESRKKKNKRGRKKNK